MQDICICKYFCQPQIQVAGRWRAHLGNLQRTHYFASFDLLSRSLGVPKVWRPQLIRRESTGMNAYRAVPAGAMFSDCSRHRADTLASAISESANRSDYSDQRGRGGKSAGDTGQKRVIAGFGVLARGTHGPFRGWPKHLALQTPVTIEIGGGQVYVIGRAGK